LKKNYTAIIKIVKNKGLSKFKKLRD